MLVIGCFFKNIAAVYPSVKNMVIISVFNILVFHFLGLFGNFINIKIEINLLPKNLHT